MGQINQPAAHPPIPPILHHPHAVVKFAICGPAAPCSVQMKSGPQPHMLFIACNAMTGS